jgi:hypothetical protein
MFRRQSSCVRPLEYSVQARRRISIGVLSLVVAGAAVMLAIWDIVAFSRADFGQSAARDFPLVATPIAPIAGMLVGILGWSFRRKTDGDRCLVGCVLSVTALIASSIIVGRAAIGVG